MNPRLLCCASLSVSVVACADPGTGYVHLEPPTVTIQPGESGLWVQYVANPFDQDMDVIDVIGEQGPGGHHAILYASPTLQPIGFTREFSEVDQVVDRFLGGLGGEGAEALQLPEGAVFRVPAGQGIYVQTHYFNATTGPIDGWSWLDVKFEPASDERIAMGMFSTATLGFSATAGAVTEVTQGCTTVEDVNLVLYSNHMHEWGASVKTVVYPPGADAEAAPTMIKDDPEWNYEWATNPNFARHDVDDPLLIPAGSRLETTCTWNNTTDHNLLFPDEMCVFFSFHKDEIGDITCADGEWQTSD